MTPAISQVCSLNSPLDKDVEDYAAGQCRALEVWLTKLETYLETHTTDDFLKLLEANEITAPVASFQGGLLTSQAEKRKEAWDLFERRLGLCRTVQIGTLVVIMDIVGSLTQQDLQRAQMSLQQIARQAEGQGVKIALEFQARSTFGNNLQTAAALVQEVGSPSLGLCLDVFHFFVGASKEQDLGLLSADNLFHVQVSDLADVARELATDSERILPGDGDFHLTPIIDHLRRIGYQGCVSLELMNPQIWQVPALQLGEIGMTALRKLLGQAEM